MEIRELEVIPVAHREPPLRNSWGIHSNVEARTIVRVTSADGEVGIGETYGNDTVIGELRSAASLVEGMDPYDRKKLALRMHRGRGRGESSNAAFSAIETALLDLIGKTHGEPVYNLLGGKVRDEVEYSAYLFFKDEDPDPDQSAIAPQRVASPEEMVQEARQFVDQHGFRTLKLKGGVLDPEEEVRTLHLLADEFGEDVPLRIDPNAVWSVETATKIAQELEASEATIEFLEDPVPTMNAHARLKKQTTLPVATNMYVTEFDDLAPAVDLDAVDVVLSDHHYWGGMQNCVELDRIVRSFDLGIGMHSNSHLGVSMAAMTHVGAALPTLRYACDTHYPWESEDVIRDAPIDISGGTIDVPDDPGLGVELDDATVERMHQRYLDDPPERDDSATMRDRDPDWLPNVPSY